MLEKMSSAISAATGRKPIKFLAVGDPHISKRHLNLSKEALDGTLTLIRKVRKSIDIIVIMGDILDTFDTAKLTYQRMAIDFVNECAREKFTAVLIGNHDRPSNQDVFSEIHPFMGVQDTDKLIIVNKPKIKKLNGHHVLFMPYVPPGHFASSFQAYVDQMHKGGKWASIKSIEDMQLIFAHQEFKGASYGPVVSSKGDLWSKSSPMVISGHIHSRTMLQDNIFYVGSLYPISINEGNDKGPVIAEYDPDSRKLYDISPIRVVTSQKFIRTVKATDNNDIVEMLNLGRENTKYVVQGTSEELAPIRERAKGKGLNIVYDILPTLKTNSGNEWKGYDDILKSMMRESSMISFLEEIIGYNIVVQ